ncbi:GGDEF domain-containing protein [Marinobacter sp. F4216]|uniref:GGDEF domain-containing protein n=1 Tax=Marinobacter sp. F4216 TaxID=2874281 RepID=UPI001CC12DD2|nr:GGDEF domain-containing protein [Marinobacter sp. F4216]MBZ2169717.1 GGDEF domain-containing protein [Marinobacter sp. F4216]
MLHRLKTDFRLSIITLLGVCAVLGVAPFAVFRFIQGQIAVGLFDVGIVIGVLAAVAHGWITGRTGTSGLLLSLLSSICAVIVGRFIGEPGMLWAFPCLITNFLLTTPRLATGINLITITALMVQAQGSVEAIQLWSFFTSAVMVSACAYAFAHRNASQRNMLEHLATIDPLTGVRNRRCMDQELAMSVAAAERTGQPYTLALLDLDHFKRINDQYGHSVGDDVLTTLVNLIQQNTRRTDFLFRYGGEEFVLLLPGTAGPGVKKVMCNLQATIRKHLRVEGQSVTASFGVAELDIGEGVDGWLERADAALYRAKEAGRDRIIYAKGSGEQTEPGASQEESLLT